MFAYGRQYSSHVSKNTNFDSCGVWTLKARCPLPAIFWAVPSDLEAEVKRNVKTFTQQQQITKAKQMYE